MKICASESTVAHENIAVRFSRFSRTPTKKNALRIARYALEYEQVHLWKTPKDHSKHSRKSETTRKNFTVKREKDGVQEFQVPVVGANVDKTRIEIVVMEKVDVCIASASRESSRQCHRRDGQRSQCDLMEKYRGFTLRENKLVNTFNLMDVQFTLCVGENILIVPLVEQIFLRPDKPDMINFETAFGN